MHGVGRAGRRGSGAFLAIVVVLVLLAAALGIAQMSFSRHVVGHVHRAAVGEIAALLAESAVQEAVHAVRRRVNDPADPLFVRMRQELLSATTGEFAVDVDVPRLRSMLARPANAHYTLDGLDVRVTLQRLFTRVPYEKDGVISCRASVGRRLSLTQRVVRTLTAGCEFKVALLAPPRPFDQVTLMVTDTNYLVQGANRAIRESLRALDTLRRERDAVVAHCSASSIESVVIPSRAQLRRRVHEFADPLTIFSVAPTIQLERIDLPRRLEAAANGIDQVQRRYESAHERVVRDPMGAPAQSEYREALEAIVTAHRNRLETVRTFQRTFVEFSGRPRDKFADFFYKLELPEWRAKAFHRVEEAAGDVNGQLDTLRSALNPLNGVVFVDNPTSTLDLTGPRSTFSGRVVIVTTGNVVVGGTSDVGEPDDLTTLVSFGSASVRGRCRASIIANHRVSVDPGATIVGNLVLREVRSFGALHGTVSYDGRIHSGRTSNDSSTGAFTDYYYVAVAPGESFVGSDRR